MRHKSAQATIGMPRRLRTLERRNYFSFLRSGARQPQNGEMYIDDAHFAENGRGVQLPPLRQPPARRQQEGPSAAALRVARAQSRLAAVLRRGWRRHRPQEVTARSLLPQSNEYKR